MIPSNRGRFTEKIAIIGAGPAGLSCAFYLAERGYNPVVFEKNALPGGMMVYGIPAYKLQKDVVAAADLNAHFTQDVNLCGHHVLLEFIGRNAIDHHAAG